MTDISDLDAIPKTQEITVNGRKHLLALDENGHLSVGYDDIAYLAYGDIPRGMSCTYSLRRSGGWGKSGTLSSGFHKPIEIPSDVTHASFDIMYTGNA